MLVSQTKHNFISIISCVPWFKKKSYSHNFFLSAKTDGVTQHLHWFLSKTNILIVLTFLAGCGNAEKQINISTKDIAEGDLVFRKGNGTKSRVVLGTDPNGMYSHVGIVVKVDSSLKIIHITPDERENGETEDRIKIETFEQFFAPDKSEKGIVLHWTDSLTTAHNAATQAIEYYNKQVLFDHDYNLQDSTQMYCTELVWRCYQKAGKDISEGRRSEVKKFPMFSGTYIFPSDIYVNKNFKPRLEL